MRFKGQGTDGKGAGMHRRQRTTHDAPKVQRFSLQAARSGQAWPNQHRHHHHECDVAAAALQTPRRRRRRDASDWRHLPCQSREKEISRSSGGAAVALHCVALHGACMSWPRPALSDRTIVHLGRPFHGRCTSSAASATPAVSGGRRKAARIGSPHPPYRNYCTVQSR